MSKQHGSYDDGRQFGKLHPTYPIPHTLYNTINCHEILCVCTVGHIHTESYITLPVQLLLGIDIERAATVRKCVCVCVCTEKAYRNVILV